MEFIWDPLEVAAAILLSSAAGYALLLIARRNFRPRPNPEKTRTYACGEVLTPEEIHPDSAGFFSPVKRVIRPFYRKIGGAHTGDLNRYLSWIIGGLLALFVILLVMVVFGWP